MTPILQLKGILFFLETLFIVCSTKKGENTKLIVLLIIKDLWRLPYFMICYGVFYFRILLI